MALIEEIIHRARHSALYMSMLKKVHNSSDEELQKRFPEVKTPWSDLFSSIKVRINVYPFRSKSFDPHEFYREDNNLIKLSISHSFKNKILKHAYPVSDLLAVLYRSGDLKKMTADPDIEKGFQIVAENFNEALAYIARLLWEQKNGQHGELCIYGSSNFFYVKIGAEITNIVIERSSDKWHVSELDLRMGGDGGLMKGSRIFARY